MHLRTIITKWIQQKKESIFEVEDRPFEIINTEDDKEKGMKKSEESLHELWDTNKKRNLYIMTIPKQKGWRKGKKYYLKK